MEVLLEATLNGQLEHCYMKNIFGNFYHMQSKGATTLSLTTFSLMTLGIKGFYVTLSITVNQHTKNSA